MTQKKDLAWFKAGAEAMNFWFEGDEIRCDAMDSTGLSFESAAELLLMSEADGLGGRGCSNYGLLRVARDVLEVAAGTPRTGDPSVRDVRAEAGGLLFEAVAILCDRAGWTEHGTSIRGAWLTSKGENALVALRVVCTPCPVCGDDDSLCSVCGNKAG